MGQRIVYYKSRSGKNLKAQLTEDYSSFRDWMLAAYDTALKKFDEKLIPDDLKSFLQQNETLNEAKGHSPEILDALTFEYLLTYCDYGEGSPQFEIIGPMMNKGRYSTSTNWIESSDNSSLKALWAVLVHGRSVFQETFFIPYKKEVIGFWTVQEQIILLSTLKNIKNKLSVEHPIDGIEYVIQVLEEIAIHKQEIVLNRE